MSYTGSRARAGRGTKLSVQDLGDSTWVPIFEMGDASRSGGGWGTEDVSNFDSGPDEEFITTMRNNGEVNLSGNNVPDDPGQLQLRAAYADGLLRNFKIEYPAGAGQATGEIDTFKALVLNVDTDTKVKSGLKVTVKLKVSGPISTAAPVPED